MITLFALISLILGLHFLSDNLFVSLVLTLLFVIFIIYRFHWKKSLFILSFMIVGALFSHIPRVYNSENHIYQGVVVSSRENYFLLYSHGERFYVYNYQNDRIVGDLVSVKGDVTDVSFATYESQIDFNQYLANKGVKRAIQKPSINVTFNRPLRIQNYKSTFLSKLNNNAAPLVDAMVFNTKDYDSSVVQTAESIQLIFLLSTAGIYFSFFIRSLKKVIYLKFDDHESHLLSLLIVSPYVVFSFPKVGVLRVFLLNLMSIPPKDDTKPPRINYLTKVAITHFILLSLNPYWAFDIGFLIGLGLTISVYFFRLSFYEQLSFKSRLVTPILVFLLLQPLIQFQSGQIHLLTFFEQFVMIPVNEVFIVLSLIGLIGIPMTPILNFSGNLIYECFKLFEKIDLKVPFGDYGTIYVALFYCLFVVGLYLFESKRYRHVRYVAVTGLLLFMVGLLPIQPSITSGVYFVNVGQGDSIIIQDHFHAVMIDTGGNISFDMAKKTLIPFMNRKQIYHLDALITTHDDYDHSGAASSLMENFKVKTYLTSNDDFPYQSGNIYLENLNRYESKDENESSLVLYLNFHDQKYLFMGDAPKEIERQIIKDNPSLKCDILKVGHHGSKTSTDESFIQQVQPKEAIISCGKNNKYGHPNKEVLEVLNHYDVKIRRTDVEGTISYLSYFTY